MAIEKYYSPKQVIEMLGISMSTLDRLQRNGEITPDWAGCRRRFTEKSIVEHMTRKRREQEHIREGGNGC